MDRRGFIKGIVIGTGAIAADVALVKLATPLEAAALVAQRDVLVGEPLAQEPRFPGLNALNGYCYIEKNSEYLPIGIITDIRVRSGMVDATMSYDGEVKLIPGLKTATASFRGPY